MNFRIKHLIGFTTGCASVLLGVVFALTGSVLGWWVFAHVSFGIALIVYSTDCTLKQV